MVLGQSMKTQNKLVAVLSLLLGPNERKEMASSKLRSVSFFSNFVAHFCYALSRSALRFAARARHCRDWGGQFSATCAPATLLAIAIFTIDK